MNIFVIKSNYDGSDVIQFDDKKVAEEFCAKFLRDNVNYGGRIEVFEGRRLRAQIIKLVDGIELI